MALNVQMVRQVASLASTYIGLIGQLIVDLGTGAIRVHDGATPGGSPTLMANNNLADLPVKATARGNLVVDVAGTAATLATAAQNNAEAFATAADATVLTAAEAFATAADNVILAMMNFAPSDAASGYFYIPNINNPAKPWLVQWKVLNVGATDPANQPAGVVGSINVFNWPINFPHVFRFGGAMVQDVLAFSNFSTATLRASNTAGGQLFVSQSSGAGGGGYNCIVWGVGN